MKIRIVSVVWLSTLSMLLLSCEEEQIKKIGDYPIYKNDYPSIRCVINGKEYYTNPLHGPQMYLSGLYGDNARIVTDTTSADELFWYFSNRNYLVSTECDAVYSIAIGIQTGGDPIQTQNKYPLDVFFWSDNNPDSLFYDYVSASYPGNRACVCMVTSSGKDGDYKDREIKLIYAPTEGYLEFVSLTEEQIKRVQVKGKFVMAETTDAANVLQVEDFILDRYYEHHNDGGRFYYKWQDARFDDLYGWPPPPYE